MIETSERLLGVDDRLLLWCQFVKSYLTSSSFSSVDQEGIAGVFHPAMYLTREIIENIDPRENPEHDKIPRKCELPSGKAIIKLPYKVNAALQPK